MEWRFMPNDLRPWPAVSRQARRWIVERTQGWAACFRRLARDDERLPETLVGLHLLAFVSHMVQNMVSFVVDRS